MDIDAVRKQNQSMDEHIFNFKVGERVVLTRRFEGHLSEPKGSFYIFAIKPSTELVVKNIDYEKGTVDCIFEFGGLELFLRLRAMDLHPTKLNKINDSTGPLEI